jgi:hypothetical protein
LIELQGLEPGALMDTDGILVFDPLPMDGAPTLSEGPPTTNGV